MADRVGQQFGQYRLTRFLGRGSFGEVYLSEHIHKGILAAVKVLQARLTPEDLKEFINEASTTFRLHHPNIVQLLDFGIGPDDTAFLTMAYAQGGTLRQRHPRGTRLPPELVVSYAKQIAAALQHAHDERLIHRDVKPENILLGPKSEVWLSDFGMASVAHSTRSLTAEQSGGTVPYMAPEQIQGKPRPASDQYALGIMAYEWLCGERPFMGTAIEIAMQHALTPPPPLRGKVRAISTEVEQVVLTALAKDPKQRFGSVSAFARALEQAARPPSPAQSTSSAPSPGSASQRRQLRLDVAQLTDVGRKAEHNEDTMAYVIPKDPQVMTKKGALFIVADGLEEQPAGEVAAEIAVDTVSSMYYQDGNDDVATSLLSAIKRANASIHQRAAENRLRSGMGTTCVAAVLRGNVASIANVGDSRAYLVRGGQVWQVSRDHSWVAEQVDAGLLTEKQARTHAQRHVLTRCLGTQADVEVDVFSVPLEEDDSLILCTDGLSGLISDADLQRIVAQFAPQESVYHLVERANENGGPDNITAIVVHVQEVG